jgi:hypothetical protein
MIKQQTMISVPGHTLENDVAGEVDGSARGIQLKGLGSGVVECGQRIGGNLLEKAHGEEYVPKLSLV